MAVGLTVLLCAIMTVFPVGKASPSLGAMVFGPRIPFRRSPACGDGGTSARCGLPLCSDSHKCGQFIRLSVALQMRATSAHSAYVYVDANRTFCCRGIFRWAFESGQNALIPLKRSDNSKHKYFIISKL